MIIIVTGTPGTGKTTIAKALAKRLRIPYIDVNKVIDEYKLKESYDRKRHTDIVDEKKLSNVLVSLIKKKKNLIIDSHLSHYLPKKHVDVCIVTKTDIKELKKRLEKRKYPKAKVQENVEAEIFDICHMEAQDMEHNILLVDTTKKSVEKCISCIEHESNKNKR